MSRYVDAEWLKGEIRKAFPSSYMRAEINMLVNLAPTIDIVRCRECKYWDDRRNDAWWSEEGACDRTSRLGDATYRNHDDFCSYGEREGE